MDLTWSDTEEAFRAEARSWLRDNVPRPPLPSGDTAAGFAAHLEWERALHEARWAVVSWPSAYGGFNTKDTPMNGRDLLKEYVDGCRAAGLKVGFYFSGPDWHFDRQDDIDAYFERAMPNAATQPLFDCARELGIGFYLGFAELAQEGGVAHHHPPGVAGGGMAVLARRLAPDLPGVGQRQVAGGGGGAA